jgi:2-furoate---CoA ligase
VSLGVQLAAAGERHPGADAVVAGAERWDYAGLVQRVKAVAGGLTALGVGPGIRVAAAARNRPESLLLYWATQWLGGWYVALNWRLTADEIGYCVADSQASVFAYEPDRPAVEVAGGVSAFSITDLGSVATSSPAGDPQWVADDQPALMLYTSGTTGPPKGVPRSQRAEWSAALAHVIQCRYPPGERTLGVMPWYHTMGMRSLLAMAVVDGCLVVQDGFSGPEAAEVVAGEGITSLYLAPTLYHDMVQAAAARPRGSPRVARLAYAGAPMSASLVNACVEAFRPDVFVNHYGSTEIYTFSVHPDQRAKPGCAGRPGVHGRLRLVRTYAGAGPEDVVPAGETGQIACEMTNPEAFSRYWNRPDADARAIRDGWYFTGDMGYIDGDGDLWVQGRVDDMIITGGENVFPSEVEEVLITHPDVRDVAVVGLPDDRLGQTVVAWVVAAGQVDAAELDRHCLQSATLAPFKRPRHYHLVAELPKTPSGKVLRHRLRDGPAPGAPGG